MWEHKFEILQGIAKRVAAAAAAMFKREARRV